MGRSVAPSFDDGAIPEREARLRMALAATSQGLYDLDVRTGTALVTPEYLSMIGEDSSVTEFELGTFSGRLHPDDSQHVAEVLAACIRGDVDEYREEFRIRHTSGAWVWVLSIGRAVERDEDGVAVRVLGSHTNITEHKQSAEALADRERWLTESQRIAKLGHYFYDIENDRWDGSLELYEVLNVEEDDERNLATWLGRVHPVDRNRMSRYFTEDVLGKREPFDLEYRVVGLHDGRERWVHGLGTVDFHEDGHPVRMFGIIQDITGQKLADAAVRGSGMRYRTLLDRASDAVFVFTLVRGKPSHFQEVNERACTMLGYTREELLGVGIESIDTPENVERIGSQLRAHGFATFESEHFAKDGSRVPVEVSASLFELEGELTVFSVVRDITERRTAELELEQREIRLEELLAERQRNLELVSSALESIIEVVSQVVEARDPYTAGHQRRVSELAVRISEDMGKSAEETEEIRVAALLHDVGKMSVPAEILSKPGTLSIAEFNLIKTHSEAGCKILASATMAGQTAEMVYQHHERCDGSGYPRGLRLNELLDGAKVLMVADVVEAMSSHRPYRAALGIEPALAEIEQGAGERYDAEVVASCVRVFRQRNFVFSDVRERQPG